MKPIFLVCEGMDGAGKGTGIDYLSKLLRHQGCSVKVVRAMGSGEVGHVIREQLLKGYFDQHTGPVACCLAILDAYKTAIKYLEQGHSVIMDRFIATYYAYNVCANQEPSAQAVLKAVLLNPETIYLKPDHHLLFDVQPTTAMQRMQLRGNASIIDERDIQYHKTINQSFHDFYSLYDDIDWTLIDNNQNELHMQLQLETIMENLCQHHV